MTPLHWASKYLRIETALLLVEKYGADINAKDNVFYESIKSNALA